MSELFQFAISAEFPRSGMLRWLRRLRYLEELYKEASKRRDMHKATGPHEGSKARNMSPEWKRVLVGHLEECEALCEEMCAMAKKMDTDAREILGRCQYRKARLDRALKRRRAEPDVPEMREVVPEEDYEATNEPEVPYCLCRRGTYGTMVGCDNRDCKIEWFHLECVGLKELPQGGWM